MRMIKAILILILLAIAALLAYATTRPDTFKVERSAHIQAPPEKVFPLIADFKSFNSWNPYAKKDPSIQNSYSGPASGPGARYSWVSKEVGEGSMEISEASPPSRVAMKLDFVKPFEAHNQAVFTVTPDGSGASQVTWTMSGPAPYFHKVMSVIVNLDRMIGADFEDGLAHLKTIAEGE